MTTLATVSSLREAISPEALTRARRRLLTASDWVPPHIAALDGNTIATADPHHSGAPGRIGARNPRTATHRGTTPRHLRRHARRTRCLQQGSGRRLRPWQLPPGASHYLPDRPGPRDQCGTRGTGPAGHRRPHYRRTRPGLGPQPDHARPRRRCPTRA